MSPKKTAPGFTIILLTLATLTGCATTSEQDKMWEAINRAQTTADEAKASAEQAQQTAEEAKAAAAAANEKAERMFDKSMRK
jgi:uncharacterized lipoprotein NlpE involved in copper resistance